MELIHSHTKTSPLRYKGIQSSNISKLYYVWPKVLHSPILGYIWTIQAGQYFSQGNNILELYILVEIASPKVKRYLNTKVENFL